MSHFQPNLYKHLFLLFSDIINKFMVQMKQINCLSKKLKSQSNLLLLSYKQFNENPN